MHSHVEHHKRIMKLIAAMQFHESEIVREAGHEMLRWWFEGRKQPLERALGPVPSRGRFTATGSSIGTTGPDARQSLADVT
ncbi:hypothetical protein AB2N04_14665 [Nitratireductor sp. GISD-1A_MAKvit]|uniref:hypothetical protein n=1 Tax=Nitratireductor sp. GISD-1A_MAKvit TaxID=3234198 RepID=UPI00346559CD